MSEVDRISEAIEWLQDAVAFLQCAKRESAARNIARANRAITMAQLQVDRIVSDELEEQFP